MTSTRTRGRRATEFRTEMKAIWQPVNAVCRICGQGTIDWDGQANAPQSFEIHHLKDPEHHPELEFEPTNVVPSHSRCNRSVGRGGSIDTLGETTEPW